jgi:hypothetical protein
MPPFFVMETHLGMIKLEGQAGQPALPRGSLCHQRIEDTSNDPCGST